MNMKYKNTGKAVAAGLFAILALGLSSTVLAGEAVKYKNQEATPSSDFFDQNIYGEGVNQLDLGRWGRKISGEALPSKNVNIFDEVPDSGFFTNRHGRARLSAEALEKGGLATSGTGLSGILTTITASLGF